MKKTKKTRPPSMWVLLWYYPVGKSIIQFRISTIDGDCLHISWSSNPKVVVPIKWVNWAGKKNFKQYAPSNGQFMLQSKHLVLPIVARRNFFLITFNWLANALVYNGLSFYSADLGEFQYAIQSTILLQSNLEIKTSK